MMNELTKNFNNPAGIAQSWYIAARSAEVRHGRAVTRNLLDQQIALYRGDSKKIYALAARCPHLGADLGRGKVSNETLQCPFHHWTFAENGTCTHIPYREHIPETARTFAYPVEEKYGFIWIFNGPAPKFSLPTFPQTPRLLTIKLIRWNLNCHHHLIVSNAIDLNHWRCVHGFEQVADPGVELLDDFGIRAHLKLVEARSRPLFQLFGGRKISATISILGGNLAIIEVDEPWKLHILIAHRPLPQGRTASQMLVFFPAKNPLFYWTGAAALVALIKMLLMGLLLLDDRDILNRIHFWPHLTKEDGLLAAFVQQVNKMEIFDPTNYRPEV